MQASRAGIDLPCKIAAAVEGGPCKSRLWIGVGHFRRPRFPVVAMVKELIPAPDLLGGRLHFD
jgi:hypothetical protein